MFSKHDRGAGRAKRMGRVATGAAVLAAGAAAVTAPALTAAPARAQQKNPDAGLHITCVMLDGILLGCYPGPPAKAKTKPKPSDKSGSGAKKKICRVSEEGACDPAYDAGGDGE
jgi:hypothetical protein